MIENDPVSLFLRRVLLDPASHKLLTFAFSLVLVINCADNVWQDWNKVPLLVIFGSSLLYSAFALLVVAFKKQESVANCRILKTIFRGRTVFWHEIQEAAAVTFALANVSGIVLNETSHESALQAIFSSLNIVFFTLEWYFAAEKSKSFVTEENPKLGHNCLNCILGGIHAFPLFFNIIRGGCLIAALVLVAVNSNYGYNVSYYIYFLAFAITVSFMLFALQTSGSLENAISTKLVSGKKWHTYLMLIVVIHCFLAVLTFSILVDSKEVYRGEPPSVYNNYWNRTSNYRDYDYYYTRRYYGNGWERIYFNAPVESPIAFALSCVALILSILDLYARAIYSRSRRDNEITAPLYVPGSISKIEDLPISVASPHIFDNPNKQQLYI